MNVVSEYEKGQRKMTLKHLEIGKSAVIKAVGEEGALRQHFGYRGSDTGAG